MVRHTTGILCVPMKKDRAELLELPPMVANNTDPKKTAFTVSCDVEGTGTGVSAKDRTLTIKALADPSTLATQLRRPGHLFPLVARPGGVLERRGHTEASVDLCILAGLKPVALLAELNNDNGTMCRLKECYAFAKEHGLRITTVEALVQYRIQHEQQHATVELIAECEVPIQRKNQDLGTWKMMCFRSLPDGLNKHVALVKGDLKKVEGAVLTRIHSECFTSHVIGSRRCDCSEQFDMCLSMINERGCGVAIYVDGHEGRGIGLYNKIKAYSLQHEQKLDTYAANEALGLERDSRKYHNPKAILKYLGISKVALMTNNPLKVEAFGDIVATTIPIVCQPNEYNADYLKAKREFEINYPSSSSSSSTSISSLATTTLSTSVSSLRNVKEIPIHLPSPANIASLRVGLIRTSWNETLVTSLTSQCKKALLETGVREENIVEDYDVPGSFELPFAAQSLAKSGRVDAVICFGVLIKGETLHFEYISNAVSQGLMQVQLSTGVPMIYGVLNCLTKDQAVERCGEGSALPLSLAATAIRMASLGKGVDKVNYALSAPMQQPCF